MTGNSFDSITSQIPRRAPEVMMALADLGYDFYCGVPCSMLLPMYAELEANCTPYAAVAREDLGVGLAFGAWLGGKRPVLLMQNSGLGTVGNALVTLPTLYRAPILLVMTWRGHGADAPEHVFTGARTTTLLDQLDVSYRTIDASDAFERSFHEQPGPVALLVRPGMLS